MTSARLNDLLPSSDALILEERVFWMINHWTNSQLYMSSIERLKHEAVELIPQAAILQEPPAYWPSATGSIEVEGLEARYADGLPLALKGISFTVKPGVGFVKIRHIQNQNH